MRPELEDARRRAHEAAEETLQLVAEDLAGRAARDAPISAAPSDGGGTLRGTAAVGEIEEAETASGSSLSIEVSFSTVYAARQHEEVTWKHPHGGKAKYLESNLLAMGPRYERVLAAKVKEALGG